MAIPTLEMEQKFKGPVAGIDEAGRGPLAGPVVAAAVLLKNPNTIQLPQGIDDSKKLKISSRHSLFIELMNNPELVVGVGISSVDEIDKINILEATMLAMRRAIDDLSIKPTFVLIDGNRVPDIPFPSKAITGGDRKCLSISAASIIAKVTRDRLMYRLSLDHPEFGWDTNYGYATSHHRAAILQTGITRHHRKSFGTVRKLVSPS